MVKLNWVKGKNFGLALIFLGFMGLVQLLAIAIGQYGLRVGSQYAVIFIPIGIMLATMYAVIILFESSTSMAQYRKRKAQHAVLTKQKNKQKKKKQNQKGLKGAFQHLLDIYETPIMKPVITISFVFLLLFGITLGIGSAITDNANIVFIIAENIGGIGCLIYASYVEEDKTKKTR